MKKIILTICGAIAITLLMVSSATAVPKATSDPLMNIVNEIEKNKQIIEENTSDTTFELKNGESINLLLNTIQNTFDDITRDVKTTGFIFRVLIIIIALLIYTVQNLITLVNKIIDLVEIINTLVDLIGTLIELITEVIDKIIDIFTPGTIKST